MSDGNTVWILGAGFSRPLGGPLIDDLLAYREKAGLGGVVGSTGLAQGNYEARVVFNWGRKQGYWSHAEQFLDMVEESVLPREEEKGVSHARGFLEAAVCR